MAPGTGGARLGDMRRIVLLLMLGASPETAYLDVAHAIEPGDAIEVVRNKTSAAGDPDLHYSWCNRAGCVESDAARGTKLAATWMAPDGDETLTLSVQFCRLGGRWVAASIDVRRFPPNGAWGTSADPKSLFSRFSSKHAKRCLEGQ